MKKILITTSSFGENDQTGLEMLRERRFSVTFNPHGHRLDEETALELIKKERPVGLIAGLEPLTERVLKQATELRAISRLGAGLDNVDLAAAERLNIRVTNTPDAPVQAVAELTVGLLITVLRSIHLSDSAMRANRWERRIGRLVQDQTVGIVGCGRIGTAVAGILGAMGARVAGFDPYVKQHARIELVSWDELLRASDLISLHVPLTDETKHLINAQCMAKMKKGVIIVNASRGGLIDEQALENALRGGHVGGACLDCYEEEPYQGRLKDFPRVVCTPHIGSYTIETRARMEKEAVQNLLASLGEV